MPPATLGWCHCVRVWHLPRLWGMISPRLTHITTVTLWEYCNMMRWLRWFKSENPLRVIQNKAVHHILSYGIEEGSGAIAIIVPTRAGHSVRTYRRETNIAFSTSMKVSSIYSLTMSPTQMPLAVIQISYTWRIMKIALPHSLLLQALKVSAGSGLDVIIVFILNIRYR